MSAPVPRVGEHGLQWQRTTLAWRRSTLSAGAVAALAVHQAASHGWDFSTVPALLSVLLTLALLGAGQLRERQLRLVETGTRPWPVLLVVTLLAASSLTTGIAVLLNR